MTVKEAHRAASEIIWLSEDDKADDHIIELWSALDKADSDKLKEVLKNG